MARGRMFALKDDSAEQNLQWPAPARKGDEMHTINGIWNTQDATAIPPNALADAKNVSFRGGVITRRAGILKALGTALSSPVRSFHWAQNNTGADSWFLAFANKTAYKITGATVGSMTATDTTGGFTVDKPVQCCTYLGQVYAVNGTDALSTFDLTAGTWAAITKSTDTDNDFDNAKLSKYIVGSHDLLFLGGSSAAPQTVYISDLTKGPTYFPTGQEVTVDTNDGQPITGLSNFDDWVIVWKSRSFHSIPPKSPSDTTFTRYLNSPTHGCPSSRSAVGWEGGYLFFQSQDGHVYALARNEFNKEFIQPVKLTANLNGTVSKFTQTHIAASWATIHDGYYKLYCGGAVLLLDLLESNVKQGSSGCAWTIYKYENVDQPILFTKPDDLTLWGGGSGDHVWRHDAKVGSDTIYYDEDITNPVDWYAHTGIWDLGRQELYKLFDRAWVFCASQGAYSMSFAAAFDFQDNPQYQSISEQGQGFVLGVSLLNGADLLGGPSGTVDRVVAASVQAKRIQLRFKRNNGTGAEQIKGVVLYYVPIAAA